MHFAPLLSVMGLAASASAAVGASQMTSNIDAITQLSSETNDMAKEISITNFFSKAPQVINNFKDIISTANNDITAMNSKGSLQARQDCLDVENPEQCLEDIGEIVEDPSEILGGKRALQARQECLDVENLEQCLEDIGEIVEDPSEILGGKRSVKTNGKKRADSPSYSDSEQQAVCNSFRGFVMVHQELLKTVIGKHGILSLTPFTQPIAAVLRTLEGVVDTLAFGIIDTVPTCAQDATQNKNNLDSTLQDAQDTYNN